jgi:signal transduction histidine kinase
LTSPLRHRPWADRPLRAKGLAILVLPLLLLGAAAAASVAVTNEQTSYATATRAASAASDQAGEVLVSLLNAETGARGYVLTGDRRFLEPWQLGNAALPGQLQALERSAELRPAEWAALRDAATAEMSELATLLEAQASGRPSRAVLDRHLLAGKSLMDRVRSTVAAIARRIQSSLARRRAHVTALRSTALSVAVTGVAIGLLGVLAMFLFIRRLARRVDAVRGEAHRLGLGETLVPSPVSGDEIGRLAAELYHASGLLAERSSDLVQAHRRALAAARDKDEFMAQLGHELRTPLTAVAGFGQLLAMSDTLDDDDVDSVAQIVSATNHLIALTEEISGGGREDEPLPLATRPTSLSDVAAESCALMGPLAQERDVSVVLEIAPDAAAQADPQRLSQVLINLLSNAVKYNRTGGTVHVRSQGMISGRQRVTVTDTGIGIRAELQPRVFAPYERLDAESGEIAGTGIGLALSRAYVEAMGGAIGVDSVEGRGTTFWFELPPAQGEPRAAAAVGSAGAPR